jgi:CRISPR-associated endoribonuclease Cas6
MRLYLQLSPPKEPIPLNHINVLTGALHKWLGPNDKHDELSLYSFGWLKGSQMVTYRGERMLIFPEGAEWFISALDSEFLKNSITGIFNDPDIRWGMRVEEVRMRVAPEFKDATEERFLLSSPVFLKRQRPDGTEKHFIYTDPESDQVLTENFCFKLGKAGLSDAGAAIRFDRSYPRATTKLTRYPKPDKPGYEYRSSFCPVLITGTPEQKAFAWKVGVGQGTGVGFGSINY